MIYTIGLSGLPNTVAYPILSQPCLHKKDILVVNTSGDRFCWEKGTSSQQFQLRSVVPTPAQESNIEAFINGGGTLITSLVNPFIPISTFAFKDELSLDLIESLQTRQEQDGDIYQLSLSPYNWLPKSLFSYAEKAYKMYEKGMNAVYSQEGNKSLIVFRREMEAVQFQLDNHATLIFTVWLQDMVNPLNKRKFTEFLQQVHHKGGGLDAVGE